MRTQTQGASVNAEQLLTQFASSPTPELRERLVEQHLYIAAIIARRFSGRGVDYDDLYQVASMALFKAIDRYDPTKGIKFVSFVTPTMVGEVKNYFRDRARTIRMPRRGMQLVQQLRRACSDLEQELGRAPRVDELADRMNISEAEVLETLEMSSTATPGSLDAQIGDDEDSAPLSKFLGVQEDGYEHFERNDMLSRAMQSLDERQQEIIRRRYFQNKSQREVAEELNISQMTVSRAERQALQLLREQIQPEDPV